MAALICGLLAIWAPAGMAQEEVKPPEVKEKEKPEKPAWILQADMLTQYVFRGVAYSRSSMVFQPSFTGSYKGIALNVWGNLDTSEKNPLGLRKINSRYFTFNEADITISYSREVYKNFTLTAGFIYYILSNNTSRYDSQEIYAGFGYKLPWFEFGFAAYREVGHFPGTFLQWYVSRSFDLPFGGASIDLWASWGAELSNDQAAFPIPDEITGGYQNEFYQSLHAGHVMVTVNFPVGQYVKISPKIMYWYALGGQATSVIGGRGETNPGLSWDKSQNHVLGGVNVSVNF